MNHAYPCNFPLCNISFARTKTAALFIAAIFLTTPVSAIARDGAWRIELTTQVGTCEKSIVASFVVQKDDIIANANSPVKADGAVEKNGSMWGRLRSGRDMYRVQGKLGPNAGSGTWSSNTRMCGGKWRGKRK